MYVINYADVHMTQSLFCWKLNYSSKNLKEIYSELANVEEVALIPFFDVFAERLAGDMKTSPEKYCITDSQPGYVPNSVIGDSHRDLVVKGKIVRMRTKVTDISNYDPEWIATDNLEFNGQEKDIMTFLMERINEFAKSQNPAEIEKRTTQRLLSGEYTKLFEPIRVYYKLPKF